jgi:hypothetical protein
LLAVQTFFYQQGVARQAKVKSVTQTELRVSKTKTSHATQSEKSKENMWKKIYVYIEVVKI